MGCDIHITVERKVADKWICVDTLSDHHSRYVSCNDRSFSAPVATERHYRRFAKLAGVRGEGPEPKGVPEDVSETTKFLIDDWGRDAHSHSYMPLDVAAAIFLETATQAERDHEFISKFPASHYFNVESESLRCAEHRIVFWFDS